MRTLLALTTATLLVILAACNRQIVNLDYTNANGEVPPLGNLVFRFSKDLVKDSLLDKWDSSDYVSFEPKIPGRFRWQGSSELVFSPERPLAPATTYKVKINKDVLQYVPYNRIGKADNLTFHTPALQLQDANVMWVLQDDHSNSALPQMDLFFNYPMDPAKLKEKLNIAVDGSPVNYNLQTVSASDKITVRLLNLAMSDKEYKLQVTVDKGVTPEGGTNATTEPLVFNSGIPSPYVLNINDVTTEHDGAAGTIFVKTSQEVVPSTLAAAVKIDPAIKISAEPTEDGFVITSDQFEQDKSYVLNIVKGLRGRIGGVLHEDFSKDITFGQVRPTVSFANDKAVYLSQQGEKNVLVKIFNVPKVKVVVSKIYENNLLAANTYGYTPQESAASRGSSDGEGYDEEGDGYRGYNDYENSSTNFGDVVYEKEIDTRSLPKYGNGRLFNFNIEDKLPDFKGIYHIMIRSTTDYWVRDSRFISQTDIGMIAKQGKDKIVVFANSIKNAMPLQGVNMVAYGANNQVLGMASTNVDGVAEIVCQRKEFAGFKPAMVIAKTADDFNYLPFNNTRVNTSRFEVGGKTANPSGLDAFIYPERDIYRPGERANFAVVVRDANWKAPGDLPLKMKFLMPNGKELKTFRKNLNEQGALDGSVDISTAAVTGSYTLEVYTSNDVLLGTQNFMIEEFVPDRIKVTAKLDKTVLEASDKANLAINAVNFFGPPAANRHYECEIQLKQASMNPKKYPAYDFTLANQHTFFDKIEREGSTDAQGNAGETFEVPEEYHNIGLLRATFFATVFDETGRPVSRSASANIYTQPVFLGVADDGYGYYPLNQQVKFPLMAVDKNEQVTSARARVEVIKHEYRTVLTKSGSYFRYDSQKEDKVIVSSTVSIGGEHTTYNFMPRSPGEYELRVSVPGSNNYVSKSFYSYGFWGGSDNDFEVNTEGQIDIALDKASYNAGETAKVLFKTPFSGKMLVTTETDHLVSWQYVTVDDKRAASIDLKLTSEHLPNVYVTATLIKPHGISETPLTVAHGFQSVRVEEASRHMAVQIIAPAAIRSKTHQRIKVKAASNSVVTLAAVDNGILQVSDFKTPDPYAFFYARRALGVDGFDLYPLLFPELRAKLSSTGGDGGLEMDKRVNPMPAKRFKLVSYWSGVQTTNGSGEATFDVDIPQFSGEVRLMAVACKNESFGSGEAAMKVADPVVLSTALPRFLSPGDTVTMPVTITNTTAGSTSATATVQVQGPLQIVGSKQQQVTLSANNEQRVVFKVAAANTVSVGKINVSVKALNEQFTDETEISVRPPSTLQKLAGSGTAATGNQRVSIGTGDFLPGSTGYQLVVSRSPAIQLGSELQYLVQYPYGCTEQTVSAAFPQLYFADLAGLVGKYKDEKANANSNILEAIRKIKMRQLYNGAVTLWDNEGTEDWWATVYAAHFLLEAQKAGFDVDKSLLETMLGYLNSKLRNRTFITYFYNRDQQKKIAPKEVAYSLYVLAMAGRPNISAMNYYKANPAELALDSRYLLSAAYAVAGDKARFKEMLPSAFTGEVSVAQTGGSYYSDIRDEAIALNVLLDVDPANTQVPAMAKHVTDKLKQRAWYSTQECAFGFLALGKLARGANQSAATADIRVNGKTVAAMSGASVKLTDSQLGGTQVDLQVKNNGLLYYWWQSEGISSTGAYKEEDSYIKARRKFFDRFGHELSGNTFKQNDLVIVQLSVEKSYSGDVDNVVLTDLIPAGFEIENPRTKDIPGMDWIKNAAEPTALDVRDDRINFFIDIHSSNAQVYYYAVRAVSPGVYRMGPVSADAMYNGEYHSYNGAGWIRVQE